MDNLIAMLGSFLVIVLLFLIFRELACWYWKINELIAILKQIRDRLDDARPLSISSREEKPLVASGQP